MQFFFSKMASPIGTIYVVSNEKHLTHVLFQENWKAFKSQNAEVLEKDTAVTKKAKAQLKQYFAGKRKKFELSTELEGTDFQLQSWQALLKVPYGKTVSYQQQANILKNPKAVRAIGGANRVNPICIIIPCHRVVGKSGSLTGYSGGLERKKFLLNLEGHQI